LDGTGELIVSHYEERLEQDLTTIRKEIEELGTMVDRALENAVHALLTNNRDLANDTILGDAAINRRVLHIDRLCHRFVVRHLPSAGPLRFVSSVLRLDVALERIGDYAVTVSRETLQLQAPPPPEIAGDVELIAQQSRTMLRQALQAFVEANVDLARGTMPMDQQIDITFQKVYSDLVGSAQAEARKPSDLFALLAIISSIGRVSDQAKNICEQTVFAATGDTKVPKVWRVLFVDEKNDVRSQMAEGFARKAFPDSGEYFSGGWHAAEELEPRFTRFMDRQGMDLTGHTPRQLDTTPGELARYHVIVSLEGDARPHIDQLPYRTVLLNWDVGPGPEGLDQERAEVALETLYKEIAVRVRDLMETLRGYEAYD
jgi:phosphate transport system protein